jgi:TfoX/Sxy family transcriptional regulator of competence genes
VPPVPERPAVEERFTALVESLVGRDGVRVGSGRRGFGSDALQVNGRIFAMVSRGRLVFKLPRERVAALIAGGEGAPFDAGKGRPMKEWVALEERAHDHSRSLAEEALAFVSGRRS